MKRNSVYLNDADLDNIAVIRQHDGDRGFSSLVTRLIAQRADQVREKTRTMKFYVRMDSYWQNSPDYFFGPYATRIAAEAAVAASGAGRHDLGQGARDVRHQTRILGILSATDARRAGMNERNQYPALDKLPGTTDELAQIETEYASRW